MSFHFRSCHYSQPTAASRYASISPLLYIHTDIYAFISSAARHFAIESILHISADYADITFSDFFRFRDTPRHCDDFQPPHSFHASLFISRRIAEPDAFATAAAFASRYFAAIFSLAERQPCIRQPLY